MDAHTRVRSWIAADEPPACEVVNREGASRIVVVCDHASARIPRRLGTLGLDPGLLDDHIDSPAGIAVWAQRVSALLEEALSHRDLSHYRDGVTDCHEPRYG